MTGKWEKRKPLVITVTKFSSPHKVGSGMTNCETNSFYEITFLREWKGACVLLGSNALGSCSSEILFKYRQVHNEAKIFRDLPQCIHVKYWESTSIRQQLLLLK
jgi:hypothetical protein